MDSFDALVVGGGVMGSATALELGRRGKRVALFERSEIGHDRGSSHGATRIFRLSYPDPSYVSLALQSIDDWKRLERDSGSTLLDKVGGLDVGPLSSACAAGMGSAGVAFDELTPSQVRSMFDVRVSGPAIFQADASVIASERTVTAQVELAASAGVEIFESTAVTSIKVRADDAELIAGGDRFSAGCVVLAAGGWTKGIAGTIGIGLPLTVTREHVTYVSHVPPRAPIVIDRSTPAHYLVPHRFGAPGAKVGVHHDGREVDPDDPPSPPEAAIGDRASAWVERLTGEPVEVVGLETCLYTNTEDEDFIIERRGPIVIVSACSGHGFKFGPRIGRVAADLVDGSPLGAPPRLADLWTASGR